MTPIQKSFVRTLQLLTLSTVFAFAAFAADSASGATKVIPGTSTGLAILDGFSLSEHFPGLQGPDGSSIVVNAVKGPVSEIRSSMTVEALEQQGIVEPKLESMKVGDREATMIRGRAVIQDAFFHRLMLLTGDESSSVLVIGTVPLSADAKVLEQVEATLKSTRWPMTE